MSRLRVAVVALFLCCCCCCCRLVHASSGADDASVSPAAAGLKRELRRETEAPALMRGANDQVVVAGEAEEEEAGDGDGGGGRMDLELEDYPGSGANDRHSPWREQRRN